MFWAPCGPWGWGWLDGVWGSWGVSPTHVHMYMHAHTHTHAHIHIKHDNFNCKWLPPLGESLGIPYDVICTYACMCVHMYVSRGHPQPPHTPIHPPPPPMGETPGISQNSITLQLIEIFQFCLKIWNLWRLPHPWVGVWFGGCVGRLMGGFRSNH